MLINLRLAHRGWMLIGIPLVFEAALILVIGAMLQQVEQEIARESWARDLQRHLTTLNAQLTAAATAAQQYGATVRGEELDKYRRAMQQVPPEFAALRKLGQGRDDLLERLGNLEETVTKAKKVLDRGLAMIESGNIPGSFRLLLPLVPTMRRITQEVDELTRTVETIVETSPAVQIESRRKAMNILAAGMVLNVLLAVALVFYFNRATAGRLAVVTDNARRLARGQELNRPLTGSDEIALLDAVFHETADTLEKARRKQRAAVDNAVEVILSVSEEGKFTAVNGAVERAWGYRKEQLQGRHVTDVIHGPDRQAVASLLPAIMSKGSAEPFECRLVRPDGSLLAARWSCLWAESERSLFCVAHDISERKQAEDRLRESEEALRTILEIMPIGLLIVDDEGLIDSANPAAVAMLGCTHEELSGTHVCRLTAAHRSFRPVAFRESDLAASLDRTIELDAARKDGSLLHVEMSTQEFQAVEGRRYLVAMVDVSERHAIEQLKSQFVAMVGHDLRTPLGAVHGFITALSEGVYGRLADDTGKKVAEAEDQAAQLMQLIADLLDIEKIESGSFQLQLESASLGRMVERAVEAASGAAAHRHVGVRSSVPDLEVVADQERLVPAITRLLLYAIELAPRDSQVEVSASQQSEALELRITCQAPPLPPAVQAGLFDRFLHSQAHAAGGAGSRGLGLALARALVDRHGGQLGVMCSQPAGLTLWLRLPRAAERPAAPVT
ncbi:MAG TPA: PAS domain S-box protein [Candidatus Obscuribacterales bacterium]